MVFGKKEREIEKLILKHFNLVGRVLDEFHRMVDDYFRDDKRFKEDAFSVHTLEREADDVRREIQAKLAEGAFLPIYREDYIMLSELVDKIANKAETVGDSLVLTRPQIPDFVKEDFKLMVDKTVEVFEPMKEALQMLDEDTTKVLGLTHKIAERESKVDEIVWNLIKKVFKSKLELAHKLHLKGFIENIATISNRIEDASDRFAVMIIKRKV